MLTTTMAKAQKSPSGKKANAPPKKRTAGQKAADQLKRARGLANRHKAVIASGVGIASFLATLVAVDKAAKTRIATLSEKRVGAKTQDARAAYQKEIDTLRRVRSTLREPIRNLRAAKGKKQLPKEKPTEPRPMSRKDV